MPAIALVGDWMIDGTGSEPVRDGAIVLEDGIIAWVGNQAGLGGTRFTGCDVRRFPGSTLLPGFVDAHTHFTLFANGTSYEEMAAESNDLMLMASVRNAGVHLRAGVTTARDNGSRDLNGFALRDAISRGFVAGPRLLVAGPPITPTAGHFHFCNGTADGEAELERAVERLVSLGADHIKVMASGGGTEGTNPGAPCYSLGELTTVVASTHAAQRLVTAHCRAAAAMQRAVRAGVDCMEHGEFMLPDGQFVFDEAIAEEMIAAGTYLSPTLQASGWDTLQRCRKIAETRALSDDEALAMSNAERETEIRLTQIGRLLEMGHGPRIVGGTDAGCYDFAFGHVDYSMHLMVAAGMSEMAAIEASTLHAAQACGVDAEVGSLEVGKWADVVVIDGDPLLDIDRVGDVRAVFQRGLEVPMQ